MAMSLPLSLALVFCALWFAQNPFLQDACFKYSAQIICFLNWTAFLYKFAYARGRAAREAEHVAETAAFKREREQYVLRLKETHVAEIDELDLCITQLTQHYNNVSNTVRQVAAVSANGCTIVWE